jgi:hypothetical protein
MEKILFVKTIGLMDLLEIKEDFEFPDDPKSFLDQLPAEILIEIFKLLSLDDLKAISMVCKRFSEIVNNDKEILRNFTLCLNHKTVKGKWIGSRKYSRVKISLVKSDLMYGYRKM